MACAAARAMSSPSPVDPPPLLPRCRAADGSATPVPPSSTTRVTHPACRTTDTPTGAAVGVCRKTFSSNVSTIAPSTSGASGTQAGSPTSISHTRPWFAACADQNSIRASTTDATSQVPASEPEAGCSDSGVVLFHVAFGLPFAIFLLRNFFTGIPRDLIEAARMDGATEWVIFRRVVLPVAKPAIASLTIFQFLWVWNDLLVALVFADQDSAPITVALRAQLRQFGTDIDVLATGVFLSMIVPLAVFLVFQKYFVQGVLAGSTK